MIETFVICYATLAIFSLLIAAQSYGNWRRIGGGEQLVIGAGLYYFSLYGAWTVLSIKRGVGSSSALDHLEASLFRIEVDGNYLHSLILYGVFDALVLAGIWVLCRRFTDQETLPHSGFRAPRASSLITISMLALVLSVAALWGEIRAALDQGVPLYIFTRTEVSRWFKVHQLLNRVGLISLACAWPIHLTRASVEHLKRPAIFVMSVVTGLWLVYLGALGNRSEVLVAVFAGFFLFVRLGARIRWGRLFMAVFFAYFALRSIETLRAIPSQDLLDHFLLALTDPEFWNPASVASGSESLAAHVSMYGILALSPPWIWGESAVYFVQSLLPFVPDTARVQDSYSIYAAAVGAPQGQGFNIHFAAGSYLNFGPIGVVFGAILLAALFAFVQAVSQWANRSPSMALPATLAYCYFCAMLPVSMRAGPEGLKALIFEGYVIPFLIAMLAVRNVGPKSSQQGHGVTVRGA
ncbi:MAG: hypothetical protein WCF43_13605 [Steroidobacteraceae bacterium]